MVFPEGAQIFDVQSGRLHSVFDAASRHLQVSGTDQLATER